MLKKRLVAISALAVVVAVPTAAPAQASTATSMVSEMNTVRRAHGLGPLRMSKPMNRSAYRWGRYLMRRNWLGHASLRKAHAKGEIIEMHGGKRSRIRGTMRGWMGSPAHRAILLTGRFHVVGVGKTSGRFGSKRSTIWVARFK